MHSRSRVETALLEQSPRYFVRGTFQLLSRRSPYGVSGRLVAPRLYQNLEKTGSLKASKNFETLQKRVKTRRDTLETHLSTLKTLPNTLKTLPNTLKTVKNTFKTRWRAENRTPGEFRGDIFFVTEQKARLK